MENGKTLPERPGASKTPKDPQDAKMENGQGKPTSKAPSENSKPPKPKKEKAPKVPKPPKGPRPPKTKKESAAKPSVEDPESMFKVGFLSDVYQERPVGPEGISKVTTRFPPEPNGFLHIGHSKAIAINFGFAKYHGGECYLRFDDTNPAGEKKEYDDSIEDTVRWLGFKPVKITHSSDNFDRLYALAEALIEKGGAYVCHCTKSEIVDQRGGKKGEKPRYGCLHRSRPASESMTEFRAMRDGKYKPGEAALRMKQNLEDGNPQMWDVFAYRIPAKKKDEEEEGDEEEARENDARENGAEAAESNEVQYAGPHYRTGDKWKIYPTYDFTHCLCDSFEGITHSLCTTEFELSRVSYDWLNNELDVYRPMQREYGRLSVSGTILSKRKIHELVKNKYVRARDDPRLYTLPALRRRGVPPGAILSFVNELGVTKAVTNIEVKRFETSVRRYLEVTVPRLMLVLDPVKVVIDNLPDDHLEMVELPFSKDPAMGSHTIPFAKIVYIERSDFREVDSPDYFRLAPGKTVGLMKAPFPITATSFEKDPSNGNITLIHATYEKPADGSASKKPKSFIHWVASCPERHSPIKAEVRIINPLFKSDNPAAHPEGFLKDVNPDSEEIFPNAMIETGFEEIKRRAPWPAEAGEKAVIDEAKMNEEHAKSDASTMPGNVEADGGDSHKAAARPETVRFQGMRMGYFCVDKESSAEKLVLNRIVSLKEDTGKD
ncbi:MAG: hypothetical protein ASARMPREDX12_003560 [Alectoria sarmentosa]|nr:MAG: hypothetical protein ASARMPREDX12_003560 [Alectoria sarmentosa]